MLISLVVYIVSLRARLGFWKNEFEVITYLFVAHTHNTHNTHACTHTHTHMHTHTHTRDFKINVPKDKSISLHTLTKLEKMIFQLSISDMHNFIVTQQFENVISNLNYGNRNLNICGPKGVGKSLSLCAIAVLLKESGHRFLIFSPACSGEILYTRYIQSLYDDFSK